VILLAKLFTLSFFTLGTALTFLLSGLDGAGNWSSSPSHTIVMERMSYSISLSHSLPPKVCLCFSLNSQWILLIINIAMCYCLLINVHQILGSDYFGELIFVLFCCKISGLHVPKIFVCHLNNPVIYSALTNYFWTGSHSP